MSKLIDSRQTSRRAGTRLTESGGWLAIAAGAAHAVLTSWGVRAVWSEVADEGWLNTFTLARPATLAAFERAEAFWFSLGSFGLPLLILGGFILWTARQGHRVPGGIGVALFVWAGAVAAVLPASPAWVVLVAGALILVGDRRSERAGRIATQP